MSNSTVTINLVVMNGQKYIKYCLDAVLAQTHDRGAIEFNILDNNSGDQTKDIVREFNLQEKGFKKYNLIELKENLGVWPGQEELLKYSGGKYIIGLCVDVLIDKDFITNAIEIMESDENIGAVQAKIYRYDPGIDFINSKFQIPNSKILDTCGFKISRSRRIVNIGHGEEDKSQYDNLGEIFGVEGAVPFLRRGAIEDIKINGRFIDHDYFWYGDDLDFAWRMNMFGWKQIFAPSVIAWHDRQTTKSVKKTWLDYLFRVPGRRQIPIRKRRLDWRNTRWTIIKNDYTINLLKDLPFILGREIAVFGYSILFEPAVLIESANFFKFLPRMLKKRREIMKKAIIPPFKVHKYFQ
jgi:GT2 family glycosyltransferase